MDGTNSSAQSLDVRSDRRIADGILAGVLAGTVFLAAEVVAAAVRGESGEPLRIAASILLGREVLLPGQATVLVLVSGALLHYALSIAFGIVWAIVSEPLLRAASRPGTAHPPAAIVYGVVLWLVNVELLGRALFPWVLEASALLQLLLHALAFGLPLGLYFAAREPAYRARPLRRRTT